MGKREVPPLRWRKAEDGFEEAVRFIPGFDKRSADPSKNYGIVGMEIKFLLRGPDGVIQFLIMTDWYPIRTQQEYHARGIERSEYFRARPMGADVGYHAKKPQYEDQSSMGECEYLGCECYYDGSGLLADEWRDQFLEHGETFVWAELRKVYQERFLESYGK